MTSRRTFLTALPSPAGLAAEPPSSPPPRGTDWDMGWLEAFTYEKP